MAGPLRNWFKVRFITGFFVTVPAIASAWLLYVFWDAIDAFFSPGYERVFGRRIPGLGFLTAVLFILFMGTIATNVVGRRILARIERVFARVPIFRSIYPSIKQLIESFSPEKRQSFKAVVLAEHPREGEFVFGFVTSEVLVETPGRKREMVTVFVPTNNLYLGDVIMVPRQDVISTGLTVEEGIRIILSAGTATPSRLPRERL
ncbi:MAG: DUF502 domain-containing protein [Candidatus Rokubacteria bacterium]|jgi:uncharacterized membrane protein|nr:DUF502 domain-containing protein [Candidatus Rokubacteria bacterium]HLF49062.1 DUF502 domain-containing protein [Methylomirabilota bacterium]